MYNSPRGNVGACADAIDGASAVADAVAVVGGTSGETATGMDHVVMTSLGFEPSLCSGVVPRWRRLIAAQRGDVPPVFSQPTEASQLDLPHAL